MDPLAQSIISFFGFWNAISYTFHLSFGHPSKNKKTTQVQKMLKLGVSGPR